MSKRRTGDSRQKKSTIKRESAVTKEIKKQQQHHQQQKYSSWINSFSKRFSVEFQEVEKDNLQIKENMEE